MHFPKIAHIIADLNGFGGTEATLLRYIQGSSIPIGFHNVIVLKSIGVGDTLGTQMVASGISVVELNLEHGLMSPRKMARLYRELKNIDPDVISGWLYHPSLLASVFSLLLKRRPTAVWNIRSSNYGSLLKTPGRYVVQRMLSLLSHVTRPILVSNSSVAVGQHAAIGFDVRPERWEIIHNGVSVDQYSPADKGDCSVRRELGIPFDALLVGCVGRFVPEKGYEDMFKALALTLQRLNPILASRVHFLAIGEGITAQNQVLMKLAASTAMDDRFHFLGKRADVPRILRALDIYVLPSVSEAFPNALVEAMATGLACISTNVGECREILPASDFIVEPRDTTKLAQCIVKLLEMSKQERITLGQRNRERVISRFTLSRMVASFDALFKHAAAKRIGVTKMVNKRDA